VPDEDNPEISEAMETYAVETALSWQYPLPMDRTLAKHLDLSNPTTLLPLNPRQIG
jgi:hypothetical protein